MLDVLAARLGVKGSSGSEDDDSIRRFAVLASLIAAIFDPIEGAVPAAAGAAAAGAWTGVLDMPCCRQELSPVDRIAATGEELV